MSNSTETFRSALHGFNRTDVVQFIQKQTNDHEKALRLVREEVTRLQQALEAARQENAALKTELEALKLAAETAPDADASSAGLDAPMAKAETVISAGPSAFNELELAAYRRAELTERMARERASAAAQQMKAIFSQASEKLSVTQQDLALICDGFRNEYSHLQLLMATVQGILEESAGNLRCSEDSCEL